MTAMAATTTMTQPKKGWKSRSNETGDWQEQAEQKRNALMQSITDAIAALAAETDEVRASETLARYFKTVSQFHRYSLHNQILIWLQKPDATLVAGYRTWQQKFNRYVKKGEKGIAILAPRTFKPKEDGDDNQARKGRQQQDEGEEPTTVLVSTLACGEGDQPAPRRRIYFTTVYVFDVSQTEGDPLPDEPEWRERSKDLDFEQRLMTFAQSRGITVEIVDDLDGAEGCSSGGSIKLLPTSGSHTFVHELAHELYEHCKAEVREQTTRQQREIEADTAAHVVCQHFGIPSSSANYLALWQAGKEDILSCMERVRGVALELIEAIEGEGSHQQEEVPA